MSDHSEQAPGDAGLRLALTGLVPPGGRHQRKVLFDEIEQRLPRDPQARVNEAGQVYTEPIEVVHRARNPHPSLAAAFVGFWVTAADRPHLAAVAEPPWRPPASEHPCLGQAGQQS